MPLLGRQRDDRTLPSAQSQQEHGGSDAEDERQHEHTRDDPPAPFRVPSTCTAHAHHGRHATGGGTAGPPARPPHSSVPSAVPAGVRRGTCSSRSTSSSRATGASRSTPYR